MNELLSNSQIDNINIFSQNALASGDVQKISIDLRLPCCPEPPLGQKVLIKLNKLGVEAEMETGNIKGTNAPFEKCRVKLINEVDKGNIGFLSGKLEESCPEADSLCKECVEAFNSVVDKNARQYASPVPEMYGDSDTYDNAII